MNPITKKIVIAGVAALPTAYLLGMGIGATVVIVEEEIQKQKQNKPKPSPGPKPEHIKTPWTRKKVHKQFNDIVDKY